jgi:hypothetical protein
MIGSEALRYELKRADKIHGGLWSTSTIQLDSKIPFTVMYYLVAITSDLPFRWNPHPSLHLDGGGHRMYCPRGTCSDVYFPTNMNKQT